MFPLALGSIADAIKVVTPKLRQVVPKLPRLPDTNEATINPIPDKVRIHGPNKKEDLQSQGR